MQGFFQDIEFAQPAFLWLLLVIPLMAAWYIYKYRKGHAEIQVSSTGVFENTRKSWRIVLYPLLSVLRMLTVGLLIIALARPQSSTRSQNVSIEGIDIVMALDVSGSMLAQDLKPDRLEAAKDVALEFFKGRPDDRIGLVIFSGETFTQCPLTTDHSVLENLFKDIESGMIEDGTAIGDGLATAVNRLKESQAISKVIILLTDGVNNMGSIDPVTAAEIAETFGIRVYTIGVGSMGYADYPVQTPFGMRYQKMQVEIDEALLRKIADLTGGEYFRAVDNTSLQKVYAEIDKLEKSKMETREHSKREEVFMPWALAAAIIVTLELLLRYLLMRNMS